MSPEHHVSKSFSERCLAIRKATNSLLFMDVCVSSVSDSPYPYTAIDYVFTVHLSPTRTLDEESNIILRISKTVVCPRLRFYIVYKQKKITFFLHKKIHFFSLHSFIFSNSIYVRCIFSRAMKNKHVVHV